MCEKRSDTSEHGSAARDVEGLELLACAALERGKGAAKFGEDGSKSALDGLGFGGFDSAGWRGEIDLVP